MVLHPVEESPEVFLEERADCGDVFVEIVETQHHCHKREREEKILDSKAKPRLVGESIAC